MPETLSARTRKRLNIQGLTDVGDDVLVPVAPWLRMAFGGCALLAATGTALASPTILWVSTLVAAFGTLFHVHPFDLIYNHGIRYLRNTGPLPRRAAPTRFACAIGVGWLIATALAFQSGLLAWGYVLGAALTSVAGLVATTDICIPSMIYNALFLRTKAG